MAERNPAELPATQHVPFTNRLAHWGRMAVCVLTAGFTYPNAFVEETDLAKMQGKTEGK